jgi:hypothetical protein
MCNSFVWTHIISIKIKVSWHRHNKLNIYRFQPLMYKSSWVVKQRRSGHQPTALRLPTSQTLLRRCFPGGQRPGLRVPVFSRPMWWVGNHKTSRYLRDGCHPVRIHIGHAKNCSSIHTLLRLGTMEWLLSSCTTNKLNKDPWVCFHY